MLRVRASVWQVRGATLVAVAGLLLVLLTASGVLQAFGLLLLAGGGGSALGGVMQRRRARLEANRQQEKEPS
jgi:hypothetical protein